MDYCLFLVPGIGVNYPTDTIVAPATTPGESAIAVVRLSGPLAWDLAASVFPRLERDKSLPRVALFGRLRTPAGLEDDVLVLPFLSPASYTGEDLVEIHLHGNDYLVQGVVSALTTVGARPAEPGEFTQRAFLNGKLDLTQAEAVAELIHSKSARATRGAAARLSGGLSSRFKALRDRLLEVLMHLEATIDFPDEDIETLEYPQLLADLSAIEGELKTLRENAETGRLERDGLRVAIAGKPNAGKSSLLNALLGVERAIVTPVAGTTRDYLEESYVLRGANIQLIDTAGLRETTDVIEAEGIRRAKEKLAECDVLIYIADVTAGCDTAEVAEAKALTTGKVVWVLNKADLAGGEKLPNGDLDPCFLVSALTGDGLPELVKHLESETAVGDADVGARIVSGRQNRLITRSAIAVLKARGALEAGIAPELVVADLQDAIHAVGELTGHIVNDEVLGEIFSRFCIGK